VEEIELGASRKVSFCTILVTDGHDFARHTFSQHSVNRDLQYLNALARLE
jgi:hypothetical protein